MWNMRSQEGGKRIWNIHSSIQHNASEKRWSMKAACRVRQMCDGYIMILFFYISFIHLDILKSKQIKDVSSCQLQYQSRLQNKTQRKQRSKHRTKHEFSVWTVLLVTIMWRYLIIRSHSDFFSCLTELESCWISKWDWKWHNSHIWGAKTCTSSF